MCGFTVLFVRPISRSENFLQELCNLQKQWYILNCIGTYIEVAKEVNHTERRVFGFRRRSSGAICYTADRGA